ncbi:MAG: response regulator [Anaerolineae bacterium]|jgi:DNA-binding NarL/FixJ family response regulator|nr:response regulator [Anaerolineae bacterium]
MRVYLVEPSALVRERLQRILSQHPSVQVLGSCDCAQDAESHLRRLRPDLVILDLTLREGDGFQLLRAINRWSCQPEVLILTNDTGAPFRQAAQRLGVRHFFDKAFEFEQAMDALSLLFGDCARRGEAQSRVDA